VRRFSDERAVAAYRCMQRTHALRAPLQQKNQEIESSENMYTELQRLTRQNVKETVIEACRNGLQETNRKQKLP
jgi:hypothetical protein